MKLPTVDLNRTDFALQLHDACCAPGAFYLTNHGFADASAQALFKNATELFKLPSSAKDQLRRSRRNPWGYFDEELTKNQIDNKEIFDLCPGEHEHARTPWPSLPEFKTSMTAYYQRAEQLAHMLVSTILSNLGTDAGPLMDAKFARHTSFLRLNRYPARQSISASDSSLGVNYHTDAGAITLLLVDGQPGLQIRSRDRWHTVDAFPGALVVNIGDVVQVLSNDQYQAPVHRVQISSVQPRISAPFFYCPNIDAAYAPLDSVTDMWSPALYNRIYWRDFYAARSAGDFENLGHEVQISDSRLFTR